jgi:FKBP-type peptidyl-prolyl cis-trans isomerase
MLMTRFLLLFCLYFTLTNLSAQTVLIPAYTGYAVPAEKEDTQLFSSKNGLQNWIDPQQKISWFFYVKNPGEIQLSLVTNKINTGSTIEVAVAGKVFRTKLISSAALKKTSVGKLQITDTGFYSITISGIKKVGKSISNIQSLELKGTATVGIHFNPVERRNAASVHLKYPLEDSVKAMAFYSEIMVPEGADHLYSYYMACGFKRGYFGIQVNSPSERRVIFSVWDAGNEAIDRNNVPDSNKVKLLAKGYNVVANDFGNEGTGGHSHFVYPWKTGEKYQFMVFALTDSLKSNTIYSGYFFIPETGKWKLIASFRAPKDGNYLQNLYSFSENFWGLNGQLERKAYFGNQWIQKSNGRWEELLTSKFSYDATGKAGHRIDYSAGVDGKQFYLSHGGFKPANIQFGQSLFRQATDQRPNVDLNRNADSLVQASLDEQTIKAAVSKGTLDTTGNESSVYYHIVKQGTGKPIKVTDTVTVFYKGSLLSDGRIFDQTKEKPAAFPLNRLIKGWQLAVPKINVGGTIKVIIPSGLAYGIRSRSKDIPANSVLVFDIEVLEARQ